jgi:hypothetical protein
MKNVKLKCSNCDIVFEKSTSEYNRRIKRGVDKFYCSNKCGAAVAQARNKSKTVYKNCKYCNVLFLSTTHNKSPKFCSSTCVGKYSRQFKTSDEFKEKCRIGMRKVWQNSEYAIKAVKRMSISKRFNSKGEIEIREHFKNKFPNDIWTFGPCVINNQTIVRDMFSKKLKVCVEYDGVWHFKDIHGQLKNKQEKDLLLEKWCELNEYRLIRIKEDLYKSDKNFWLDKLENIIYHSNEKLIKFY